jgi:hypothetical protein
MASTGIAAGGNFLLYVLAARCSLSAYSEEKVNYKLLPLWVGVDRDGKRKRRGPHFRFA